MTEMFKQGHDCQLSFDGNETFRLPSVNPCVRLFENVGEIFMIWEKNPNTRKYIKSRAYVIHEKKRHIRYYKCRIHPFSKFSFCWNIFMILSTIFGLLFIPYDATFNIVNKETHCLWIRYALISLSWIDILINCNTGYFNLNENVVELRFASIIGRYVKHDSLIPDVLASIPTDVFFIDHWYNFTIIREMATMIYVFRVFSLSKNLNSLSRTYNLPSHLYEFLSIIFWLALYLHWQSCIFWIIPLATVSIGQVMPPKKESWINILNLWESSDKKLQYYQSLHRSVVTFTRSGFSKAEPQTSEDQCTVIFLQVICTFVLCKLIANMMQFFKGLNSSKLKYHEHSLRLNEYMQHKQLPLLIQRRFNKFYDFKYRKHYYKESEILRNCSVQMRQEIRLFTCRKLVESVVFFHDLPMSLLVRIVTLLKSEIFLTNDVIVKANELGNCMYFIASGTVAVYTSSGKEVCHLENGAHFGEIALMMPDARRLATVVAVEMCKLYRLERSDFVRIIHPYPLLWERIKEIAHERIERTAMLNVR